MGQIKKQRKKYNTPSHPWQAERLKEESEYVNNYGFKNKKEIWKVIAKLGKYKDQVKKIIARKGSNQMEREKGQLILKLLKYGLITKDSKIEDVLDLSPKDVMDRRLQTIVYKKNLVKSLKQSRQFIVHGHIMVADKKLTVPSYLVSLQEESNISLNPLIPIPEVESKSEIKEEKKEFKEEHKKEKQVKKLKEKIKENIGREVPTALALKEKQEARVVVEQ